MKKISLLLLTFCIFSCTEEAALNPESETPASELESYISLRTQDGLLKANPMVILDGNLISVEDLGLTGADPIDLDAVEVGILEPQNTETQAVFGAAAANGVVIIRTDKTISTDLSKESFNTNSILFILNGKPVDMSHLDKTTIGKIASISVIKNSKMMPVLSDLGYKGIVQVITK